MATEPELHFKRRDAISVFLVLVALVVVLPRLPAFNESISTLRNADFAYVWLGLLFWLSTFFTAALVYKYIALRPLRYGTTLLIQLASGFTNRLAPLGAGIITLNISYLMKHGHSAIQAGAVVALNNILGSVGIVTLLLGAVTFSPSFLPHSLNINLQLSTMWKLVSVVCVLVGTGIVLLLAFKQAKQIKAAVQLIARNASRKPFKMMLALLASMAITVGYTAALYSIGLAFNVHITVAQALFVLTLGVMAASITPTPGGIGGAEVGLVAALVAVGVSSHQALTVALLYRFIVFWLPILPGFICFQLALRRSYI